jgi:hypothetical protein
VTAGSNTYSEWRAVSFHGDTAGAMTHVAIHHRPLDALLRFSAEMGQHMGPVIEPDAFFADHQEGHTPA